MTNVAVFTCEQCPFDGDAEFTDDPTQLLPITWVCPDCGWTHQGELVDDGGYDNWMDVKYERV